MNHRNIGQGPGHIGRGDLQKRLAMFHSSKRGLFVTGISLVALFVGKPSDAQRQMEFLDRGVVALRAENNDVFVQWRLLGTDPTNTAFNLYRVTNDDQPLRLNAKPIDGPTHFVDREADLGTRNSWFVRPVFNGREAAPSGRF